MSELVRPPEPMRFRLGVRCRVRSERFDVSVTEVVHSRRLMKLGFVASPALRHGDAGNIRKINARRQAIAFGHRVFR